MANKLTQLEAEAISILQAGNTRAFNVMKDYFQRQYDYERTKCVDSNISDVEIHRGRARAFRDAVNLHEDATNILSSGK